LTDFSKFKAPFLTIEKIREEADLFYSTYGKGAVPVDIEGIIEFDLNIELQTKQNLFSLCKADAFLSSNCKKIYVDNEHFTKPKNLPYVRFSLAHEIGHLILHKTLIPVIVPTNVEEWKNIVNSFPEREYNFIELHANEFAGRLLVPRDALINELKSNREEIKKIYEVYPKIADDIVIDQVAVPICKTFQVSDDVIARRIKFEEIWHFWKE